MYAQAEIFNVINANTVLTESETLGTSVGPYLPGAIRGPAFGYYQPAHATAFVAVQVLIRYWAYGVGDGTERTS